MSHIIRIPSFFLGALIAMSLFVGCQTTDPDIAMLYAVDEEVLDREIRNSGDHSVSSCREAAEAGEVPYNCTPTKTRDYCGCYVIDRTGRNFDDSIAVEDCVSGNGQFRAPLYWSETPWPREYEGAGI